MENKKKVFVIGGGISGLTSAIYLLDNDYDVTVFEKHDIVGGLCTGWKREGNYIDGCAHFIVGTSKRSELYPLWYHIGAFNDDTKFYETEYFVKFVIDDEIITFYADLKKLQAELLRVAPEDKRRIKSFVNGIKRYQLVKIPVDKPLDMMNLFELTKFGITMLPMLPKLYKYKHQSVLEFANSFKSPYLRKLFSIIINKEYNIHSVFYLFQAFSQKDGAIMQGGSLKMALRVGERFKSKGGVIRTDAEVDKIIIKDGKACGVKLKNGEELESDFVVAATDAHHIFYDLLDGKYHDEFFEEVFKNKKDYPLNLCTSVAFNYKNKDIEIPKMISIPTTNLNLCGEEVTEIVIRNFDFDETINKDGHRTLTIMVRVSEETRDKLKELSREDYLKEKERFGEAMRQNIISFFKLNDEDLTTLDVATPLTYERYTNNYKGSWSSAMTTKRSHGLMKKGLVKGVNNLVLAGQWLMLPGGLPIAIFTGKHAAIRICKMDGKKFINKEEVKKQR